VRPPNPPVIVPSAVFVPQWLAIGLGEVGVREDTRPGKSTPRIEQYHAITRAGAAVDDVAWCASFVCWVLEMSGIPSTKSKSAASYLEWGKECDLQVGCIVVFDKTDKDAAGSGHVAFCMGVSGEEVFVLGGNQSNRVGIDVRRRMHVVAARWPHSIHMPDGSTVGE
jgi:uncharacterized protein (TIGR02594 family)